MATESIHNEPPLDERYAIFWKRVASRTGVPLEGLGFIYDAFSFAQKCKAEDLGEADIGTRHCSAAEFCGSFVRLAQEKFGAEYVAALKSWRLDTSEKLGRVIYALVRRSVLKRQYPDCESDFDSQFDFSRVGPHESQVPGVYHYPTNHLPKAIDPYSFSLRTLLLIMTMIAVMLGLMMASR